MKEVKAWIVAGLCALATGIALGAVGLDDSFTLGIAGVAVFSVVLLFMKNGYGLRKVAIGSADDRELAIIAPAGPADAVLYLVRDNVSRIIGVDVSLDGRAIARLKGGRFTRVVTHPGDHELQTTFTQGALGPVPILSRPVRLLPGEAQAVAITPPVDRKQNGAALPTQVVDDVFRNHLRSMAFVKPEIDDLR